jgi:mannose-6-phosphate isomerase-like protein (cupin superfamily)
MDETMSETTKLIRGKAMRREGDEHCHGGAGTLDWKCILGRDETAGRMLRFIHDNVLAPGVTIGDHGHDVGEEYYYILSGRGVMVLDGERFDVQAGDMAAVYAGGTHALENTGEQPMRMIALYVG